MVTTVHGFSSDDVVDVYAAYNDVGHYVAISNANRHSRLDYAATVTHGIAIPEHQVHEPGDHLLFFGRIHPDKGTADAITIARRSGRPLHIAGIVQDAEYFHREVEPHIDGTSVLFLGAVPAEQRNATLGSAAALLHPIGFDEPFGFSVAESLAVGTPVVAFDRGSMRELIRPGIDGFLCADALRAADAVEQCSSLDRDRIRLDAAHRFSVDTMVDQYLAVYADVLSANGTGPITAAG